MSQSSTIQESPVQVREQLARELAQHLSPAALVRVDELLARRTTLRVGGPADLYVEPVSEDDLAATLRFCAAQELKFFVLGRGSNLLVRDGGFRGVVICLAHANFSRIEFEGERMRCGAGAKLKNVAVEAKRRGLSGVEFLEGIPGSVGGALRMNAGAMGFGPSTQSSQCVPWITKAVCFKRRPVNFTWNTAAVRCSRTTWP